MSDNSYTSAITFLYYKNFEKAVFFFEKVLKLDLVMDQGFARIYLIAGNSFLGMVKQDEGSISALNRGGALISLNTHDVELEYARMQKFELPYITEIKTIAKIPLKSFFIKDFEDYDFEIQEFINIKDKRKF